MSRLTSGPESETGIEMVSVFLDGELDETGCARLLASAHQDADLGFRLSCYGLIREVISEHDWSKSTYRLPAPVVLRSRGATTRPSWVRRLGWRPSWIFGLGGLVACALVVIVVLRSVLNPVGVGMTQTRFAPGSAHHGNLATTSRPYGEVRSIAWNAPSNAVRQQLETDWMLHAASLSGSQMMVYPRMAAYNYAVAGRRQGWRHPR